MYHAVFNIRPSGEGTIEALQAHLKAHLPVAAVETKHNESGDSYIYTASDGTFEVYLTEEGSKRELKQLFQNLGFTIVREDSAQL
jgi:hypothetical protein